MYRNRNLYEELPTIYGAMASWRLSKDVRPIILVDWSTLKADNSLHLLSASLPSLAGVCRSTKRCILSRF